MLKRIPFHPILFAAFPVLALLATNLREVEAAAALRPLALAVAVGLALFLVLRLALRDWRRAGVAASLGLALFFAYGHLYDLLEGVTVQGFAIGRHRILATVFLVLLAVGWWWAARRLKDLGTVTEVLNVAGVVLLALPLVTIAQFTFGVELRSKDLRVVSAGGNPGAAAATTSAQASPGGAPQGLPALAELKPPPGQPLPDIYYIILDTYTRGDALRDDLGYDSAPFLDALRQEGFYVADCSRSNYSYTLGSLTTSLNMQLLPDLWASLAANGLEQKDLWVLLKHSQVRSQLEAAGYKTVAFETGYEWSRLSDADMYLGRAQQPYQLQTITPFEAMLVRSTLLLPLLESRAQALATYVKDINFPFSDHINRQLFILDQVPQIASNPAPTFAFVHLLMPHIPYVFGPDGQILTDPGFYSGKKTEPVNEDYRRRGYTGEVQYLDKRLLEIVRKILETSRREGQTPPVIILQGDHGLRKSNRYLIFNAYHVSPAAQSLLYPSITPVNSFRVIFNAYFGTHYPLMPDKSFADDTDTQVVEETREGCK